MSFIFNINWWFFNRETFADIPLEVSFGPIKLKLDNDSHTHSKDDSDDDDDDDMDQIELENKPKILDSDAISDISEKMNDIMISLKYNDQKVDGLLR